MTGIRSLLRDNAPRPESEADITELARQARSRRRTRLRLLAAITTACVAAATVGVLLGNQHKQTAHRVAITPLSGSTTVPTSIAPSTRLLPFSPEPDYKGTLPADGMYPAWPQLHVSVHLQTESVTAGTAIEGQLIVTNNGTQPIARAPGRSCSASFIVVLESPTYTPQIAWAASACILRPSTPEPVWPPGVTSIPFTIITNYSTCGGRPLTITCRPDGGPPPLPRGAYHTFVASNGMALPQPQPITVTLS